MAEANAPAGRESPPQPLLAPANRPLNHLLTDTVARTWRAVPMGWQGEQLMVGMVAPEENAGAVAALQAATGVPLLIVTIPEANFEALFASLYPTSPYFGARRWLLPRRRFSLWDRVNLMYFSTPVNALIELVLHAVLAILILVMLLVFGRFIVIGLLAAIRLLLTPIGVGVALLVVGILIYRRLGPRA